MNGRSQKFEKNQIRKKKKTINETQKPKKCRHNPNSRRSPNFQAKNAVCFSKNQLTRDSTSSPTHQVWRIYLRKKKASQCNEETYSVPDRKWTSRELPHLTIDWRLRYMTTKRFLSIFKASQKLYLDSDYNEDPQQEAQKDAMNQSDCK